VVPEEGKTRKRGGRNGPLQGTYAVWETKKDLSRKFATVINKKVERGNESVPWHELWQKKTNQGKRGFRRCVVGGRGGIRQKKGIFRFERLNAAGRTKKGRHRGAFKLTQKKKKKIGRRVRNRAWGKLN